MSADVVTTPHGVPGRRAWVEKVMGMPVSIHLRGAGVDDPAAAEAVAAAQAEFRRMDATFSTYLEDSDISRLRCGDVEIGDVDPLVAEALRIGEEAGLVTGGAFTVFLPTGEGDLAFDPTGLVKGWTVDRASLHLASLDGISWCINAGGDLLVGAHPWMPLEGPEAISWRIGIEDPRVPGRIARTVSLTSGAVATSGTAARGAHLYDPEVGEMVGRAGSVTVTGPSLLWADIWATALFVGGERTRATFDAVAAGHRAFEV